MDPKLKRAADKTVKTYEAWIRAGAEYNQLVHDMTGVKRQSITINWKRVRK